MQFIMCTATASKSTKRKIFDVLSVHPENTMMIEMSPERKNLSYAVQYVDNSVPIDELFGTILSEVKSDREKTRRTLIYCQTRNQCAILWRMFTLHLENDIFFNASPSPTEYMVDVSCRNSRGNKENDFRKHVL